MLKQSTRPPKPSAHPQMRVRPEGELLLCCARTRMDSDTAARIRALLEEELDWGYLLRIAPWHGMTPLLYQHVNAIQAEAVPEAVLNDLRSDFQAKAQRNLRLIVELRKMLSLYEANGISAIPYKGPLLASSLYENVALRPYDDLDVLVRERDVPKAIELALSQGYEPLWKLTPARTAGRLASDCEFPVIRVDERLLFEVQWRFISRTFSFPLNLERLWNRLEKVAFAGRTMTTLSPEDLLLVLCVHGTKHLWRKLKWICDIAELLRVHQQMDWDQIMAQAAELGCERMVLLGLYLAEDLLGATLPEAVERRVHADPVVPALAAQVPDLLFQGVEAEIRGPKGYGKPGYYFSALFYMRAMDRLRDRVRYCVRFATTSNEEDYQAVSLPDFLFPLYRLVRTARLSIWFLRWLWRRLA